MSVNEFCFALRGQNYKTFDLCNKFKKYICNLSKNITV